jgi:hypothetical protein
MKISIIIILVLLVLFFFRNCKTGYVKNSGDWTWVTIDEGHGKRNHPIAGIDQASFTVLENKCFAKDKYQVYFKGKKINMASPEGFTLLSDNEYGYAKDNNFVFFNNEIIINADPATFEVLEFPYARDKNDVYCGTLPMRLSPEDVKLFKVTNQDKLMAATISSMTLSHFLEFYPQYVWVSELKPEIQFVITGDWGTGTTGMNHYKGFTKIH